MKGIFKILQKLGCLRVLKFQKSKFENTKRDIEKMRILFSTNIK